MGKKKDEVRRKGGIFNVLEGVPWKSAGNNDFQFVLTPRMGSHNIGITSGIHEPGTQFDIHVHALSEELVFCHEGEGEFYLYDRWIPVKKGDVLYAPPGVKHGTRKPAGTEGLFITIGVATPPQLDLYNKVEYDVLSEEDH